MLNKLTHSNSLKLTLPSLDREGKGEGIFTPSLSREGGRGMSCRAFTLIEIMISTLVLALLITGIYSIFKGGTDSWTKGNVRMERYQNARAILGMMSREISCAMVNEARKIYMLGLNDETAAWIKTGSTRDELFFVAPIYSTSNLIDPSNTTASDMCELGYWIRGDTEIMRHYAVGTSNKIDFVYDTGTSSSLGIAVVDLQFYYYYGDAAEADSSPGTWDSLADLYLADGTADGLPKKIKIVLRTRDEEAREDTQTFETTVFMPGAE
ncbi:prepilin-type N-terminal cleavage/methylation domain-containing protein [bacterium]|nr:prepilin-type N-terminal cleavage/methylation domain-containing protein [bacterium]